jgi:hypothetical protein
VGAQFSDRFPAFQKILFFPCFFDFHRMNLNANLAKA